MKIELHGVIASLLLAASACFAPLASACTQPVTGGSLGTVTSFRVQSGAAITTSGSFSFDCSSVILSVLGSPTLKGTLQSSLTGLTLKNGSYSIPYQVYSNAGMTTTYTGGLVAINLNGTSLINLLNSGTGTTIPVYISTTPGANVPAGTYTDILSVTWTPTAICEGLLSVGAVCAGTVTNTPVVSTITVTLTVTNDCTITAPPVNFGTAPLVSGFPTVSQNISLLCSKNMTYTVGMGQGSNFASGRRQMANGSNRLSYDLYKADSTVWGSSVSTSRADGPAASDGSTVQTIPYTARVYQDQATPAAAVYTDSVVVDVSF